MNGITVFVDNAAGNTTFSQSHPTGAEPPITVARLVPRLIGCATDSYTLEVAFTRIQDSESGEIAPGSPSTLALQRGDINGDGVVDIIDAMFGAQYLVGLRPLDDIRPLNMASVHHDTDGDKKDIIDCMYIAQYVVGIRDCWFELMP